MDSNVVVAPSDVKLAKDLHSLQVFDVLHKVREWSDVFPRDSIEGPVVNDVSFLFQVLFRDHKG